MTYGPTLWTKKPVTVKAMCFDMPDHGWDIVNWILDCGGVAHLVINDYDRPEIDSIVIETLEGPFTAKLGWWIIQGVEGEFYACAPSVFEASYSEHQ